MYDQAAQAFQSGERLYIDPELRSPSSKTTVHRDRRGCAERRRARLWTRRRSRSSSRSCQSRPTSTANDLGVATDLEGTYVVMLSPTALSMRRPAPCRRGCPASAHATPETAATATSGNLRNTWSRGSRRSTPADRQGAAHRTSLRRRVRLAPAGDHRGRRRRGLPAVPAEQAQQGTRGSRARPGRAR